MNATPSENEALSKTRSARLLYRLYRELGREFMIELPVCKAVEFAADEEDASSSMLEQANAWLLDADQKIPVHQLRQFLQISKLATPESMLAALEHHLHKQERMDADRDKIDFLLVQFFSMCASSQLQTSDASLDFVARTLEPVLGTVEVALPESLHPLEEFLATAQGCRNLQEVFASGILDKARGLKISAGNGYFEPTSLVGFTRFNFLMRRAFFRLLHEDLNAILQGLRDLEQRGVATLDCRRAEFSAEESVSRLRMICQSWKVMFQAEYSSGQPLRLLADLRMVIDAALAGEPSVASTEIAAAEPSSAEAASAEAPLAKAAAASAGEPNTPAWQAPDYQSAEKSEAPSAETQSSHQETGQADSEHSSTTDPDHSSSASRKNRHHKKRRNRDVQP